MERVFRLITPENYDEIKLYDDELIILNKFGDLHIMFYHISNDYYDVLMYFKEVDKFILIFSCELNFKKQIFHTEVGRHQLLKFLGDSFFENYDSIIAKVNKVIEKFNKAIVRWAEFRKI